MFSFGDRENKKEIIMREYILKYDIYKQLYEMAEPDNKLKNYLYIQLKHAQDQLRKLVK